MSKYNSDDGPGVGGHLSLAFIVSVLAMIASMVMGAMKLSGSITWSWWVVIFGPLVAAWFVILFWFFLLIFFVMRGSGGGEGW